MPGFFNSISSYFNSSTSSGSLDRNLDNNNNRQARRGPDVLSSTRDAFSLPSSHQRSDSPGGYGGGYGRASYQDASRSESPAFGEHADGLSRPSRANLGGLSASSSRHNSMTGGSAPGFSYPPQAHEGGYEYNASRNLGPNRNASPSGSRSRTNSAGPNAFSPNGPLIYYPPPRTTWNRIQRVLANTVPELLDTLNSSVDPLTLSEAEGLLGCVLPPSVRDSYLCVDGQDPSSELKEGLFFGLTFLSLEDSLREWTFWRRVESDPTSGNNPDVLVMMSSIPSGWIKSQYACRGWLPLITDRCGNYVGVDLSPGEDGGSWGQVIVFGREFDRKCVLFRGEGEGGWGRWLAGFAEELESGEGWEIDGAKKSGDSGSDDEDDVGYQSYYYDGNGSGGGDSYGEVGSALRLTGEYKGWGVLEAWWDRSVRRWDELGMGLSQAEIRRQQEKIDKRKSARMGGGPGPNELLGLGFGGMRLATAGEDAQVAIPVLNDPRGLVPSIPAPQPLTLPGQPPASPGPETALLMMPRSPSLSKHEEENMETPTISRNDSSSNFRDYSSDAPVAPTPRRLITPYSPTTSPEAHASGSMQSQQSQYHNSQSTMYASSHDGLLSPPSASPSGGSRRKRMTLPPPPAGALDLPTRADVQAAQAVAMAEEQGLRGGWVMSMEATAKPSNERRRSTLASIPGLGPRRTSQQSAEEDGGMVDIDLEGGRQESFGSPKTFPADSSPVKEVFQRAISPLASGLNIINGHSRTSSEATTTTTAPLRTPDLRIETEQTTPRPRGQASDFFSPQPFADDNVVTPVQQGKGKGRADDEFDDVGLDNGTAPNETNEPNAAGLDEISRLSIAAAS